MQSKSTIKSENGSNPISMNNPFALVAPKPLRMASPAVVPLLDTDNDIYSSGYISLAKSASEKYQR